MWGRQAWVQYPSTSWEMDTITGGPADLFQCTFQWQRWAKSTGASLRPLAATVRGDTGPHNQVQSVHWALNLELSWVGTRWQSERHSLSYADLGTCCFIVPISQTMVTSCLAPRLSEYLLHWTSRLAPPIRLSLWTITLWLSQHVLYVAHNHWHRSVVTHGPLLWVGDGPSASTSTALVRCSDFRCVLGSVQWLGPCWSSLLIPRSRPCLPFDLFSGADLGQAQVKWFSVASQGQNKA